MERDLARIAKIIRKDVLTISHRANVGHIGSALSIVDILTVLYFSVLRVNAKKPYDPSRDRFILSKGHAAAALYAVLFRRGFLTKRELSSFCADGGMVGVHPDRMVEKGIECSTGSLGHGLSIGIGMALGLQKRGHHARVFVLLSDAELNEGSTWEAIMFAAHHKLGNLVAVVDVNGSQAFGKTENILALRPLALKWAAFGWDVYEVNGHSLEDISTAFLRVGFQHPSVILAKTVIGKGVDFMENNFVWHYLSLSPEQYIKARQQLRG